MAKKIAITKDPVASMKQELQETITALEKKLVEGTKTQDALSETVKGWNRCVEEANDFLKYAEGNDEAMNALNVLHAQASEFVEVHTASYENVVAHNKELSSVIKDCAKKVADFELMETKNELNASLREIAATLKNPVEVISSKTELRDAEQLVFTATALLELRKNA